MSRDKPTFSPETPHFFKIILEQTLSEEKLRIPNKFWRKYGRTLDETVLVKLPSGDEWEMKLTKHKGKFWLMAGWPEFSKHYALERGNLLIFRYVRNSKFNVVIFDKTTVEIDYPFVPPNKTVKKPHKRRKISPTTKPKDEPCKEIKGKSDLSTKRGGVKSTTIRKTELKPFRGSEKIAALQKASGFESKRPFVKILIQPSYLRQSGAIVPSSFANKHLRNESKSVMLKVLGKRTWLVKYHQFKTCHGGLVTRLSTGWLEFAWDNHLKVGDVCVFVLRKGAKSSFEVVIFRDSSKASISPALAGEEVNEEMENSPTNEFEPNDTSPAKQTNEGTSTPGKRSAKTTQKAIRKHRFFSKAEKDRILERAHYESEKPFFKVVIQPAYAIGNQCYLGLPSSFVKRYIKKDGDIVLLDAIGRSWSAQLAMRSSNGYFSAVICNGWRVFVEENNVEVGDVCVFELVKRTGAKTSFKVSIVRVSDHDD